MESKFIEIYVFWNWGKNLKRESFSKSLLLIFEQSANLNLKIQTQASTHEALSCKENQLN